MAKRQAAALILGIDPEAFLAFSDYGHEVVVIAPDGRKYRLSIQELEGAPSPLPGLPHKQGRSRGGEASPAGRHSQP
jgi:hypothetical protein